MMTRKGLPALALAVMAVALLNVGGPLTFADKINDGPVATLSADGGSVTWRPRLTYARLVLTVALPNGEVARSEFEPGRPVEFRLIDAAGVRRPDGVYTYEVSVVPELSPQVRATLAASRAGDEGSNAGVNLPAVDSIRQSGSFRIEQGQVVLEGNVETTASTEGPVVPSDQVIPDDLIVQGSACVGLDCVDGESFGFDTVRLKENNLRIKFEDTSAAAGFPTTDWQLTANDSASGGANYFSINDVTAGTVPFLVRGGAPNNSLYLDSIGRLGLGTSTPVLDVHLLSGNTPAIRLDQDATGGFTAQVWDVAGNEANFFVRDVTGGSRLPFRIRPGAPTSSIDISASGNVGVGTASPLAKLHVNGNVLVQGTVTEFSDINAKENLAAVDRAEVLAKLMDVSVFTWNYQADPATLRHMGPTAQAFYAEFELGPDERHLAALDLNGVLLAATQELNLRMQAKEAEIAGLQAQNADLQVRMATLEEQLKALEERLNAMTQKP